MEVFTPVLTTRKGWKAWKSMTFLRSFRDLSWQFWNLEGQGSTQRYRQNLPTWGRSCWSHKLVGTIRGWIWSAAGSWVWAMWQGETPGGWGLSRPPHFHWLYLQVKIWERYPHGSSSGRGRAADEKYAQFSTTKGKPFPSIFPKPTGQCSSPPAPSSLLVSTNGEKRSNPRGNLCECHTQGPQSTGRHFPLQVLPASTWPQYNHGCTKVTAEVLQGGTPGEPKVTKDKVKTRWM